MAHRFFSNLLVYCEWFIHGRSFKKSDWTKIDRSDSLFDIKRGKTEIFWSKSLVFERFAQVAFWPEQIAHSCSFFKSDLTDSLMVTLLSWATWVKGSCLLFNLSDFERKSKSAYFFILWRYLFANSKSTYSLLYAVVQ